MFDFFAVKENLNTELEPKVGYDTVMQFIKKNNQLPEMIRVIESSSTELSIAKGLKNAIQKGNLNHELFFNDKCELYLLVLLKREDLSIDEFLNVHVYLSALMQYTDFQSVRTEDNDKKEKATVELVDLADIENKYIDHIKKFIKYRTDEDQSKTIISDIVSKLNLTAKPLDRVVLKLTVLDENHQFLEGCARLPLMYRSNGYYYIPSIKVIKDVLSCLNPSMTMQPMPILGTFNAHTMHKMHEDHLRPINIYSKYIKSNPKEIHNYREGPFTILAHDLYAHFCLGNLLFTHKTYPFVFRYLLIKCATIFELKVTDIITGDLKTKEHINLSYLADFNALMDAMPSNETLPLILLFIVDYDPCDKNKTYQEKLFQLFDVIHKDRAVIKEEYDIDVDEIFNNLLNLKMDSISTRKEIQLNACAEDYKLFKDSRLTVNYCNGPEVGLL